MFSDLYYFYIPTITCITVHGKKKTSFLTSFIYLSFNGSFPLILTWENLVKQAYNGIHQPKSIKEADLARKRFIFDEFFYLQVNLPIYSDILVFLYLCGSGGVE